LEGEESNQCSVLLKVPVDRKKRKREKKGGGKKERKREMKTN
jgi:hypothetical protein